MKFSTSSSADKKSERFIIFLYISAGIVLIPVMLLFFFLMNGIDGLVDGTGHMLGRDFVNVWTAGRLTINGHVDILYDIEAYQVAQRSLLGHDIPFHNWSYPPLFLPFTIPFGALEYGSALSLWVVTTFSIMLLAGWASKMNIWQLILLIISPASVINLWTGQNGFLTAALIFGGVTMIGRRPVFAGALFGLLTFKPHLGLLIPFALLANGSLRTFFSATITSFFLVLLSIILFGISPWMSWFETTIPFQKNLMSHGTGLFTLMMPTVVMAGRLLGFPIGVAWNVWLAIFTLCIVIIFWAFHFPSDIFIENQKAFDIRNALLLSCIVIASPYGFSYDMTITSVAVILLLRYPNTFVQFPFVRLSLFTLYILPAGLLALNSIPLPIGPLVMLSAFVGIAWVLFVEIRCIKKHY